jgi:hypothetical protein
MGRLSREIRQRLDNIMAQSFTILVGDANGVDKAVQKHCADKCYDKVIVFCAGNLCRNNVGNWDTKHIAADRGTRDYKFYMVKDIEMAKEADYGFMIWDAKSSGTLSNILQLLEMNKKVLVYVGPLKDSKRLHQASDLQSILKNCPEEAMRTFEDKFNLSARLQTKTAPEAPRQLSLFA